jgi:hypothetical protein
VSQKTTTGTTNNYNQAGMANYNSFQPQLGSGLSQMLSNPLGNSFFNQQYQAGLGNAQAQTQRNMSNILANQRTGGGFLGTNGGAFQQTQLNKAMLGGSAMQAGAFNSALGSSLQNRNYALSAMEGYNPLQTGATTTQQTSSGVGGILGAVASAGLNMAMPGIGSMLGGGSFGGGYGGSTNPYQTVYNAQQGRGAQGMTPQTYQPGVMV